MKHEEMSVLLRASPPEAQDLSQSLGCECWVPGEGAVRFLHGGTNCPPSTPIPTLTPAPPLSANKQSVGR